MKDKKVIIGVIVGIVVVVGVILTLIFTGVFGGGNYPTNLTEFRKAIEDKTAINCTMTIDGEDGDITYQANDGWTKFRMIGASEGTSVETIIIEGDAVYSIMGELAVKNSAKDDSIKEIIGGFTDEDVTEEDEAKITLKCSNPNGNNFTIPDKEWMDLSGFDDEE